MQDDLSKKELSFGRKLLLEFLQKHFSDETLINKFDVLTDLYFKVNAVINISALRTLDDVYIKHYLDSLYPYEYFKGRCCDVGCGGGFPCLPLAIVGDCTFTGLDGVGKKLTLIRMAAAELHLKNITAVHARSEDLAKDKTVFDTVCARAVANTDKVTSLCAPLVASGGKLVLYKTASDLPAKASTEKKYGIFLWKTQDYTIEGTDIKRRIFIYGKP